MYVVTQGWFYQSDSFAKSVQCRVLSHTEYMYHYDHRSYPCLYRGSKDQCDEFIKGL